MAQCRQQEDDPQRGGRPGEMQQEEPDEPGGAKILKCLVMMFMPFVEMVA